MKHIDEEIEDVQEAFGYINYLKLIETSPIMVSKDLAIILMGGLLSGMTGGLIVLIAKYFTALIENRTNKKSFWRLFIIVLISFVIMFAYWIWILVLIN